MRNSTSLAHVGVLLDLPDGLLDVSEELDYDEDDGEGEDGVLDNLRILRVLGDGSIQHQEETNQNIILTNDTDAWHLSLLVISSINVCLVLLYWIYILFISYTRSTRWKPPLLPHILLLGLLLAASAGFPNLHTESIFYCQGARITTSLSYTMIYSCILVRLVCLRSLNRGVYLPTPYQALLLLFCILVQVGMCIQWYIEERWKCSTVVPISHLLFTLYPLLLFVLVLIFSSLSRKSREHYYESRSIWLTLLSHLPVWIAWPAAGVTLDEYFSIICGLGLQVIVLLTLLILLVPRSRYLTYLSRDGYNKFENDPYAVHSDARYAYGGSKASWEPSFYSWKQQGDKESSYLGFHRPTRVVPPSPSSLSHSTFSPGHIYQDRFSYIIPPPPVPTFNYPSRHLPVLYPREKRFTPSYPSYKIPAQAPYRYIDPRAGFNQGKINPNDYFF